MNGGTSTQKGAKGKIMGKKKESKAAIRKAQRPKFVEGWPVWEEEGEMLISEDEGDNLVGAASGARGQGDGGRLLEETLYFSLVCLYISNLRCK